jgi:hypothetical protein
MLLLGEDLRHVGTQLGLAVQPIIASLPILLGNIFSIKIRTLKEHCIPKYKSKENMLHRYEKKKEL